MQTRRIPIADVERNPRLVAVRAFFGNVMDHGCTAVAVHHAKRDAVVVEHGRERAAHGAFFRPDFDVRRLCRPTVATIRPPHRFEILGGVFPCVDALGLARLVDNPFPRNVAALARIGELLADATRLGFFHRRDQLAVKELVADGAHRCGLNLVENLVCRVDEIETALRFAAPHDQTSRSPLSMRSRTTTRANSRALSAAASRAMAALTSCSAATTASSRSKAAVIAASSWRQ